MFETLISVSDCAAGATDFRIVDCRFQLDNTDAGRQSFLAGHIPGAVYADLDRDLSSPAGAGGRHPLPDRAALARQFGAWGIGPDTQIVAYDAASGMTACRLWWLARWLGHRAVAVLDGGYAAWTAAGEPTTQDVTTPAPAEFAATEPLTRSVTAADIEHTEAVLVDARAADRFAGLHEPIDFKAGHIPGAVCKPYEDNIGADGRFLDDAALAARLADVPDDRDVICYCGSGVTATHNIMAFLRAGRPEPALYPGSWSEWIRDERRPIAP